MAGKFVHEVLSEINKDPGLLDTIYKPVGAGSPLEIIFKHAFDPKFKFLLPDTAPPFTKDVAPLGMNPSRVQSELRRFGVFCDPKISNNRREIVFIQILESVHPDEADVMLAIKDQDLGRLYPNITRKLLEDAGYLSPLSDGGSSGKSPLRTRKNRPSTNTGS